MLIYVLIIRCASHSQHPIDEGIWHMTTPVPSSCDSIPEYCLGYGDVIEVKFFNNSEFNEHLTIRPDGRISMERIGDMLVIGLTPQQLSVKIEEAYSRFIKNPEVTVIVREFSDRMVYVLGEVNTPGGYPIKRNMSILQSIALAGGQKDTAKLKSVILMRRDVEGTISVRRLDLSDPARDVPTRDFMVAASDIIYVPKTFIANLNTFLDQAFSGVLQPLDIYLRSVWWIELQ